MVPHELHRGGVVTRIVGQIRGGQIIGHVEGHVVQLGGAIGHLGKTVVLHQMADGGVVVAEQDLHLVSVLNEARLLGGEVAVVLVPHRGGVVLALLVEDRYLLPLGQGGGVGLADDEEDEDKDEDKEEQSAYEQAGFDIREDDSDF